MLILWSLEASSCVMGVRQVILVSAGDESAGACQHKSQLSSLHQILTIRHWSPSAQHDQEYFLQSNEDGGQHKQH